VARVRFAEEVVFAGEIALVPRAQLVKAIRRLRDTPEAGKPLRGALTGCRSVRVGGSENRIVYEYRATEDEVIVFAIGRRRGDEVYDAAGGRRP
jgi:mRNA-degrading endonuclease RelE of RelBE toxin-antitoxin system